MDTQVTYIIQRGYRGPVKIGKSKNPGARLRQLQTACAEPLWLAGTFAGDVESELHRQLADQRLEGEWFRASKNTAELIRLWVGVEIDVELALEPVNTNVTWRGYLALVRMGVAEPPQWPRQVAA